MARLPALLLLALAAAPVDAPAAPSPTAGQTCGTPEQCFPRMAEAQRDVQSIRARFRQTKHVALMTEPLISEGRFSFERPDRVRWEMETPEPLVVEVRGDELRAGPPGAPGRVEAGPAVQLFRDLAALFTGAEEWAGERFTLGPGTSGGNAFVLTPRDPSVARVLQSIEIELDPEQGGPRRVVLREPGGDRTEIVLSDVEVRRADGGSPP